MRVDSTRRQGATGTPLIAHQLIALDFETFTDKAAGYAMGDRKLTTEHYVRDGRFAVLGMAVAVGDGSPRWLPDWDVRPFLDSVDWPSCTVVAHHAHFDGLILAHRYGVWPGRWLDTMPMARALGHAREVSLGALAERFGLPAKTAPYDAMDSHRWASMPAELQAEVAAGAVRDVEIVQELLARFLPELPPDELRLIDMTIRCFTEPVLVGDRARLSDLLAAEVQRRKDVLRATGATLTELRSELRFKALLIKAGVAENELSEVKGARGARLDLRAKGPFLSRLAADERRAVRALAEARRLASSNLDEARAKRLLDAAGRGSLPVYLSTYGAHTTRWSGGDLLNWQNVPRDPDGLRSAILPPPGHVLVRADLSQIECRILNQLAGQADVVERFRRGEDPYLNVASAFYGRPITRADKVERQLGKVVELACGYQMGADRLRATCAAGPMGAAPIFLTAAEAERAIQAYRSTHPKVVNFWEQCQRIIRHMARGTAAVSFGALVIESGAILLPSGLRLFYPELRNQQTLQNRRAEWSYRGQGGYSTKIYGGKLTENIVQALARCAFGEALLHTLDATGRRPVNLEHDAAVYAVPIGDAEVFAGQLRSAWCVAPIWMPDLPVDVEIAFGRTYATAGYDFSCSPSPSSDRPPDLQESPASCGQAA